MRRTPKFTISEPAWGFAESHSLCFTPSTPLPRPSFLSVRVGSLGVNDGVEVAVVHLSVEYFQSEACVEELRAICKKFKADHIIPVIVGKGFSMTKMGTPCHSTAARTCSQVHRTNVSINLPRGTQELSGTRPNTANIGVFFESVLHAVARGAQC